MTLASAKSNISAKGEGKEKMVTLEN